MKKKLVSVVLKLRSSDSRTRRAALGAFAGIGGRLCATAVGLATTPVIVKGLGNEGFGLSIAIAGVIQWLSLANFGLAQGLQNSLIAAAAENDEEKQNSLISTAILLLMGCMVILLVCWIGASVLIPWEKVFPTNNPQFRSDIIPSLQVAFIGFNYQLLLGVILAIFAARQDVHYGVFLTSLSSTIGSVSGALAIYHGAGLFAYILSNVGGMLISGVIIIGWYFIRSCNRFLIPKLGGFRKDLVRRLASSSTWFFVIQICWLALFQVDSFVIMHCAKTEDITPYNIAMRVFALVSVLYSILSQPLWAAYGNAASTGEMSWLKKTHHRIRIYFIITYGVMFVGILIVGPWIISHWVGIQATPSLALLAVSGLYVGLKNWAEIHAVVTNALNRIPAQALSALAQCAIYIPLVIIMTTRYSAVGTALAGAIAFASVSAWALPMIVKLALKTTK